MSKAIMTKAIAMVVLATLFQPAVLSHAQASTSNAHHRMKKKRNKTRNGDNAEQRRRQREREERRRKQEAEEEAAREQAEKAQRQRERARRRQQEEDAAAKARRQRRRAEREAAEKQQRPRARLARERTESEQRRRERTRRKQQEQKAAVRAERRRAERETADKERRQRERNARQDVAGTPRRKNENTRNSPREPRADAPRRRGPERTVAQAERIRRRRAERQLQRTRVIEHYLSQMDADNADAVRQQLAEGRTRIGKEAVNEVARLAIEGERPAAQRLQSLSEQIKMTTGNPASEDVVSELSAIVRAAHTIKSLPNAAAKKGLIYMGDNLQVDYDGRRVSLNEMLAAEVVRRRPEFAGSALAEDPVELMVSGFLFADEDFILRQAQIVRTGDGTYTTLEAAADAKNPNAVAVVNMLLAARKAATTGEGLEDQINALGGVLAGLE